MWRTFIVGLSSGSGKIRGLIFPTFYVGSYHFTFLRYTVWSWFRRSSGYQLASVLVWKLPNLLRLNAKKLIYGLYEYRFIINNNFSLSYEQPWGDGIWFDVFGNRAPRTLETCINLRFYMYLPRGFWASIAYQWCTDLSFKHFRHSVYLARSFNLVNCGHFY